MNIGIIGTGIVGRTLAEGFLKHGHQVRLATRHPEKIQDWLAEHGQVGTGTHKEVAAWAELVVLAVKGTGAEAAVRLCDAKDLAGKTVIDATNPIAEAPPENGVLKFFTTLDGSLMEQLQRVNPAAHFVKAFNSVGSAHMVGPDFGGTKPTMFICGNDEGAKAQVTGILEAFGWEVEDMGGAEAARAIEPLCMLWCIPGFLRNEWTHAFKLLKA